MDFSTVIRIHQTVNLQIIESCLKTACLDQGHSASFTMFIAGFDRPTFQLIDKQMQCPAVDSEAAGESCP